MHTAEIQALADAIVHHHSATFGARLHHDAEVGPKVVALRRRGPVGVGKTEVIREVGDLLSYGIEKDEDRFENRNVYEQAEIKRFIQPLFDNAFPWTIIDLGLK